jgi:hypothetical protein
LILNKRKHFKQMTQEEIQAVKDVIGAVDSFGFTPYSTNRLIERGIDEESVLSAIGSGKVIEVHNNKQNDVRVLLRLHIKQIAVCVVLSLRHKAVITSYLNRTNYTHPNLDWTQYAWKQTITKELISSIIA